MIESDNILGRTYMIVYCDWIPACAGKTKNS